MAEFLTLAEAVAFHAESWPDRPALAYKTETLTYGELARKMRSMAKALAENWGVRPGDRVMISAVSKPEFVAAFLAAQYLGAVVVPVDKVALADTVAQVYEDVSPRLLLTDMRLEAEGVEKTSLASLYARAEGEMEGNPYIPAEGGELAEVLFTTGTTGRPKGVMLSYTAARAIGYNTLRGTQLTAEDRVLLPLPLNHSFGMRVLRAVLFAGGEVVLQNGFAFPKELRENINNFGCTGLAGAPASMELLWRQMGDDFAAVLGALRYIEVSTGSLSLDMKKKLAGLLPGTTVYNTWGSTETGVAVLLNVSEHPEKCASFGKPMEGVEFRVLDGEGRPTQACNVETAGRMALRGEMQMTGYYGLPELTAKTIVDGWIYTGDLVYTDADGYVYMAGRADDIINVGGKKVSPVEVEETASQFAQAAECACIGVEDPEGILGQVPVLYVVPEGGALDVSALARFLSARLEPYKLPHAYVRTEELPRNRMQKLDRAALAARWHDSGPTDTMNEVVSCILSRRSVRVFQEKRVPRALVEMILKAAIQAPTGHNMQSWNFTVLRNRAEIASLKETIRMVAARKKVTFYGMENPDTVILVSNDRRNDNGIQDSSCAAENMMLAAHSCGLGSVWINALKTICDEPEIREKLRAYGIPDRHIAYVAVCFGYPAEKPAVIARRKDVVHWVE